MTKIVISILMGLITGFVWFSIMLAMGVGFITSFVVSGLIGFSMVGFLNPGSKRSKDDSDKVQM